MIHMKGRYRDRKLELDHPLDLAEGTEVELVIRTAEEKESQEREAWHELGMSRLEKEWDNPQDAIYDDWRRLYGPERR